MKNKFCITDILMIFVVILILVLPTIFIPKKYNPYSILKGKRPQSYNEKYKEHFLTCIYCKGTGERVEDTNRTMFMAKVQLYLNKHLAIDKCTDCVKMERGDHYIYCDKAEKQYQIFLQEYGVAGPKMEKTSCSECMGMGQFSSFDIKTQKYLTQAEYEQRERNKINNND